MPHRLWPCLLWGLLFGWAMPVGAQDASPTPVIVELFTSEGCSSCPPADALLRRLTAAPPAPGIRVIALSEHVDYWDDLGWQDPFASPQFTRRQKDYARRRFGTARIYTPQMVVDGRYELIGSQADTARRAIRRAAQADKLAVGLEVTPAEGGAATTLEIHTAALPAGTGAADVWLAVTGDELHSRVTRGENGGRLLRHDGVVRRLERIGRLQSDTPEGFHRRLPLSLAADWRGPLHAVVFLQSTHSLRVLGAATRRLPAPH